MQSPSATAAALPQCHHSSLSAWELVQPKAGCTQRLFPRADSSNHSKQPLATAETGCRAPASPSASRTSHEDPPGTAGTLPKPPSTTGTPQQRAATAHPGTHRHPTFSPSFTIPSSKGPHFTKVSKGRVERLEDVPAGEDWQQSMGSAAISHPSPPPAAPHCLRHSPRCHRPPRMVWAYGKAGSDTRGAKATAAPKVMRA